MQAADEILVILVIDVLLVANLGIIGYRNHAARLMSLVEKRDDCKIKYIYHPTKAISDYRSTNNISDLYSCDGVIIASPNNTHFNYIATLLENSDCAILCEKPPVTSLIELKKLEKLSIADKHRLFFNFNYRFSNISENLQKNLNSKEIGKPIHVSIFSTHGLAFKKGYSNSWRADGKKNLHSVLETVTIHYLDLLVFCLGKINKSYYFPTLVSENGTAYDTSTVILLYKNGTTISIVNSYAAPHINDISIIGTNGFFTIRNDQLMIRSPRETFDKRGFFKFPPIFHKSKFSIQNDYTNSLTKAFNYFLIQVLEQKDMDINQFEASLLTNRLVIDLKTR